MTLAELTTNERVAIREIAKNGHRHDILNRVSGADLETLRYKGLIYKNQIGLTQKGLRAHRYIMRSGDGPEELKAMFRF